MRPRDELNSIDRAAIHEAGHVAACINLDLEFDAVYLEPSKDHPGLVARLVKSAAIDYSSGVLTPEEEVLSTNVMIAAFAGPACDALHRGRTAFDIAEYEDLDEVLDAIEYRFSNNNVRIAFTHYCEAEAFALFEDDRRLWRFTHVLARELVKQKKLTYAQCTELYSKEYLVESWVRKEVDEIRREDEGSKEDSLVATYEQRAASIEKAPKGQGTRHKGQDTRHKEQGTRDKEEGRQRPPVQDRELPRQEAAMAGVPEGEGRPAEAGGAQGERRGRRRRRGRGRGRGKRKETLEQLPGEVIGGQPAEEAASAKPQATSGEGEPRPNVAVQKAPVQQRGNAPRQEAAPINQRVQQPQAGKEQAPGHKPQATSGQPQPSQPVVPAPGSEQPKGEERVKKQIIKAIKPPVTEETPPVTPQAAEPPVPPVAEQRPAAPPRADEQRPVVLPPVVPKETTAAAAVPPKRRLAVSGGPKAEGQAVSGGKGTTHPDSIWDEEKAPRAPKGEKPQAASSKPQAASSKLQAASSKLQAAGKKGTAGAQPKATGPVAGQPQKTPAAKAPRGKVEGEEVKKPTKAARPAGTKAAKAARPVTAAPAAQKKAPAEKAPVAERPVKAAAAKAAKPRPVKAAKTATKAAPAAPPAAEVPVKKARTAPAKKAAPAKAAPAKKAAAPKSAGGRKKNEW